MTDSDSDSAPKGPTRIVLKITDDIDPAEVLATTYQMRNFFRQFADGFISSLDVMNFIQHHKAALLARTGDVVLDVCCGRALMLPLLRYYRPKISAYIGVDIEPNNYSEAMRWSAIRRIGPKIQNGEIKLAPNYPGDADPYYPFPVHFIHANVAEMSAPIEALFGKTPIDYAIYTAAIEHMQREAGLQSLVESYKLMREGARMVLSSPNTSDKQNPYDTQYAAHLYEWPRTELLSVCKEVGFTVEKEYGLVAKVRGYREKLVERGDASILGLYDDLSEYLPSMWVHAIVPILTPEIADEVLFILHK